MEFNTEHETLSPLHTICFILNHCRNFHQWLKEKFCFFCFLTTFPFASIILTLSFQISSSYVLFTVCDDLRIILKQKKGEFWKTKLVDEWLKLKKTKINFKQSRSKTRGLRFRACSHIVLILSTGCFNVIQAKPQHQNYINLII